MDKIKLGIIFGGMSTEHDVSIVSGTSVISNLDKNKYDIFPIYIDKSGNWFEYQVTDTQYNVGDKISNTKEIENIICYLKNLDVVFPVLHGLYGEDGSIQGLLELLKIPYVGCNILASSVAMDKVYAKIVFEKAGLKQAKYEYVKVHNDNYIYVDKNFDEKILNIDEVCNLAYESLKYPIFVKPSNSGSSVGVSKASTKDELIDAIKNAAKFDYKILLEEQIIGREIECAVLGNQDVKASCLGEIIAADKFYSYDAKYNNVESKTLIPAEIPLDLENKIRDLAIKAFKSIDGTGFSRVDFFVTKDDIYINEINTIPGFTEISMYPKLWEHSGIKYSDLLDKLIELAFKK